MELSVTLLAGGAMFLVLMYQVMIVVSRRRYFVKAVNALPGPKPHPLFGNVPDLMVPPNSEYSSAVT